MNINHHIHTFSVKGHVPTFISHTNFPKIKPNPYLLNITSPPNKQTYYNSKEAGSNGVQTKLIKEMDMWKKERGKKRRGSPIKKAMMKIMNQKGERK